MKLPAVTKLHCEDFCLRHPHCKGFNYNNQLKECDLLRKIYREQEREMSLAVRSFMKQVLFFMFYTTKHARFPF
ncbi:PAN domain-containing protein [Klebsiella pneumoniae]|uniref:PAN domain-containing protein n=1 Tax=Klebsiella pneumoniae TaxID=573 RepID=UPI0038FCCB24